MGYMLARKDLLLPRDLPSLPPLTQWVDTLRPGIPFAFCIAAVVTALLTATNLATGVARSDSSGTHPVRDMGAKHVSLGCGTDAAAKLPSTACDLTPLPVTMA